MKIAIYPGSFDPITNGHLDIIERGRRLFDHLMVAVAVNSAKSGLFNFQERMDLIKEVTSRMPNVEVVSFKGLLVDFVEEK
ncbi:MAG: adenylyltransferase/cytidyltransferase family protein, partial [Leptospiraceae bacterium]|nr:adenylyltransferase/cytidyltransferase family protein [Leptospiraceae bacterium]